MMQGTMEQVVGSRCGQLNNLFNKTQTARFMPEASNRCTSVIVRGLFFLATGPLFDLNFFSFMKGSPRGAGRGVDAFRGWLEATEAQDPLAEQEGYSGGAWIVRVAGRQGAAAGGAGRRM
jgi:hypothetical protein